MIDGWPGTHTICMIGWYVSSHLCLRGLVCTFTLAYDVGRAVAAVLDFLRQFERALPRRRDGPFGIGADGATRMLPARGAVAVKR
jgi:hypothetical protein